MLGPVADQELFFDTVVEVACLLEGADVNFEEDGEPSQLFRQINELKKREENKYHILLRSSQKGGFVGRSFEYPWADSRGRCRNHGYRNELMFIE